MYKLVVNVSGKRARIVPQSHRLGTAEREFAELSQEDALNNRDGLNEAVKGLLSEKGITDVDLYTIEVPDDLTPREVRENVTEGEDESQKATDAKGPVTKPKNPKKGETGDQGEQKPSNQSAGNQPSETQSQPPAVDETKA